MVTENFGNRSGLLLPHADQWDAFYQRFRETPRYTAYRDARDFARRSGEPLLSVSGGGPGRGEACRAFTAHGFIGVERDTVLAMRSWVKSGVVPADVKR